MRVGLAVVVDVVDASNLVPGLFFFPFFLSLFIYLPTSFLFIHSLFLPHPSHAVISSVKMHCQQQNIYTKAPMHFSQNCIHS
jgi:hypothetical protein